METRCQRCPGSQMFPLLPAKSAGIKIRGEKLLDRLPQYKVLFLCSRRGSIFRVVGAQLTNAIPNANGDRNRTTS